MVDQSREGGIGDGELAAAGCVERTEEKPGVMLGCAFVDQTRDELLVIDDNPTDSPA